MPLSDTCTEASDVSLASHVSTPSGHTWTQLNVTGYFGGGRDILVNAALGRAYGVSGTFDSTVFWSSWTPAGAEYDVEADLIPVTLDVAEMGAGVVGRLDTAAATFYVAQYDRGAGAWRLYLFDAGTPTLLGSHPQALTQGQSYRLKLELRNASKKVFVDGVERINSSDNTITAAGRAGVHCYGASTATTGYHLDNIAAADAGGGGGAAPRTGLLLGMGVS
jgi:hypothetical protein